MKANIRIDFGAGTANKAISVAIDGVDRETVVDVGVSSNEVSEEKEKIEEEKAVSLSAKSDNEEEKENKEEKDKTDEKE